MLTVDTFFLNYKDALQLEAESDADYFEDIYFITDNLMVQYLLVNLSMNPFFFKHVSCVSFIHMEPFWTVT